ncbi:MAG: peptidoglycan-binding protein [Parcubacteria group bacterium]
MKKYILSLAVVTTLLLTPLITIAESDVDPSGDTSCAVLKVNLRYGMRDTNANDNSVSILQDFLNTNGYLTSQPSGFFGSMTRSAVVAFQKTYNISATPPGYVGSVTRAKIMSIDCNSSSVSPVPSLPVVPPVTPVTTQPSIASSSPILISIQAKDAPAGTIYNDEFAYIQGKGLGGKISITIDQTPVSAMYNTDTNTQFFVAMKDGAHVVKVTNESGLVSNSYTVNVISSRSTSNKPVVTVLSPNGGEVIQVGSSQTISWNSSNLPSNAYMSIQVFEKLNEFDQAGNQVYLGIYSISQGQQTLNDGTEVWTVPSLPEFRNLYKTTGKFVVRISGCVPDSTVGEGARCSVYDESDTSFSIVSSNQSAPTILSIYPNSGQVGTQVTVNGNGFSYENTVNGIDANGNHIQIIAFSTDGKTINFTVPSVSFDSRITNGPTVPGVYSIQVGSVRGNSNNLSFTIVPSTPQNSVTVGNAVEIQSQNLVSNIPNQMLGGFAVTVSGDPVVVKGMTFSLPNNSSISGSITGVTLVNEKGTVVAGPVTGNTNVTEQTFTFSDNVVFSAGRHIYAIKGTIPSTSTTTIQLRTTPSTWLSSVSQITGNSVVISTGQFTMSQMTVRSSSF